jgi:hypothetical protein
VIRCCFLFFRLSQYLKPQFVLHMEKKNQAAIRKMETGSTSSSGVPSVQAKAPNAAQSFLTQAKADGSSGSSGGSAGAGGRDKDEFAGLQGLKGLKQDDCKQQ